jgi:hypothetical protein
VSRGDAALPAILPISETAVAAQAQPRAPQQRLERPARARVSPSRLQAIDWTLVRSSGGAGKSAAP